MAYEQKTQPTDVPPEEFLATLPTPRRREEGEVLLEMFREVTGAPAVMWGPSMVGFGEYSYTYDSGHSGTAFRVGFSPRKAALSLYGLHGYDDAPEVTALLEQLGPHRTGAACLYVTSLKRIDLDVLRALVERGWRGSEGVRC